MPNINYEDGRVVIVKVISLADLKPEQALTLRQVREMLPFRGRGSKPLNIETLRRWANPKRGYRPAGPDAPALVLPTLMIHGQHVSTAEWVEWFLAEAERLRSRAGLSVVPESSESTRKEAEQAKERLRNQGIQC